MSGLLGQEDDLRGRETMDMEAELMADKANQLLIILKGQGGI